MKVMRASKVMTDRAFSPIGATEEDVGVAAGDATVMEPVVNTTTKVINGAAVTDPVIRQQERATSTEEEIAIEMVVDQTLAVSPPIEQTVQDAGLERGESSLPLKSS